MNAPDALTLFCQQCSGALQVGRLDKTTTCSWCGSGNIVRRPPRPGMPQPSFVIGFTRTADEVKQGVKAWARREGFWAPRAFRRLEVELLKPVYVPAYLFSGVATGEWSAHVGYDYTERVKRGDKVERVTKTEWHALRAPFAVGLHDLLISASQRISNDELAALEPFDLGRLARYSDAAIVGWPAEEPARDIEAVDEQLMNEVDAALNPRLRALVPGERVDHFEVSTELVDPVFACVLVPVWTMMVRSQEGRPRTRVLVNGQTGQVTGKVPRSWLKVALAVLLAVAALGAAIWWLSHNQGHR